jgi:hypothetical protein
MPANCSAYVFLLLPFEAIQVVPQKKQTKHNATVAKPSAFFGTDSAPTILISRYGIVFEGIIQCFSILSASIVFPIEDCTVIEGWSG